VVIWYIFPKFGMFGPRKIWQPCSFASIAERTSFCQFFQKERMENFDAQKIIQNAKYLPKLA
jgi:hypothetical protein